MKRKSISPRVRFLVLQRDDFRCRYCGATAEDDRLHLDHIHPVARGGVDDLENLLTACQTCNLGKAAGLPVKRLPAQRERAWGAVIFQSAVERFWPNIPLWRAFSIIIDTCANALDQEAVMAAVVSARDWRSAELELFRIDGTDAALDA